MKLINGIVSLTLLNLVFCQEPKEYCPLEMKKGLCFEIMEDGKGHKVTMKGPSKTGWMALGLGTGMAGSDIFLAFYNSKGKAVISHRKSEGYELPEYLEDQSRVSINEKESNKDDNGVQRITFNILPSSGDSKNINSKGPTEFMWGFSEKPPHNDEPNTGFRKHSSRGVFKL